MKICYFCEKDVSNFLEHLSIRHEISSLEEYEIKAKEVEQKKLKIQEFLKYSDELMIKYRKGEISPESLRELRSKWEKDNNLTW